MGSLIFPPNYLNDIRNSIEKSKRYPWRARIKGQEGTSRLSFKISRLGEISEVNVIESSSYTLLDQAAIQTVYRAAPFPELPLEIINVPIEINIPLVFQLR